MVEILIIANKPLNNDAQTFSPFRIWQSPLYAAHHKACARVDGALGAMCQNIGRYT